MERLVVSYRMQDLPKVQTDNAEKEITVRPFEDALPDGHDTQFAHVTGCPKFVVIATAMFRTV